ncbi:MAG: transcriptional repressor NrdR [Kiritimatiellae bacterium]|nr:transcriptional repressor NrdR [Kiritimatiellia bacterium]
MRCPKCGNLDDKVLDSRAAHDGKAIRRRRECLACSYRFTTFEEILKDELSVIKRDGRREDFSRQKLLSGITRACLKRHVTNEQIDRIVDSVVETLQRRDSTDIPSSEIGELVMRALLKLDQVAYVRFASVYQRFEDVEQFKHVIDEVVKPAE